MRSVCVTRRLTDPQTLELQRLAYRERSYVGPATVRLHNTLRRAGLACVDEDGMCTRITHAGRALLDSRGLGALP